MRLNWLLEVNLGKTTINDTNTSWDLVEAKAVLFKRKLEERPTVYGHFRGKS